MKNGFVVKKIKKKGFKGFVVEGLEKPWVWVLFPGSRQYETISDILGKTLFSPNFFMVL